MLFLEEDWTLDGPKLFKGCGTLGRSHQREGRPLEPCIGPFTAWTFPAHKRCEDDCTYTGQDASIVSVLRDGMSSSLTSIPS